MSFLKKILPINVKNISVNLNMYSFIYFLRMKNRIAFLLYFLVTFSKNMNIQCRSLAVKYRTISL